MVGLGASMSAKGRPPENPPDRIELPAIDLDRLGDGETLAEITVRAVGQIERAAVAAALQREKNPAAAAKRLGISRASIYTKMKQFGIQTDGSPVE
jgi:transcriptional regulator of acetoin/glycerol metabolism